MLLICDKCPLLRIYENKTKTKLLSLVRFYSSVLFCLFVFFFCNRKNCYSRNLANDRLFAKLIKREN